MNVMLTGRVTMVKEDGTHVDLVAPQTFVSGPGRKVGYIHETVVWQNIYSTDETDIEKLEEMFLNKSMTFKEHQETQKLLLTLDCSEDQKDYYEVLKEFNFTEEVVRKQTENLEDQIPMPYGNYGFMLTNSNIEGKGVFATKNFIAEEEIGPARISGMRTPLGRFTNHSKNPNAKMVLKDNGDIYLVAVSDINGCQGGQLGKEITVDYRQVLALSLGEKICQE
jgi:SET domain-containing protein